MAGVRWICGLAVVGFAAAVAVQAISDKLHGGFYWTVAIPAATVFALNWIGIDFPIKRLARISHQAMAKSRFSWHN